MNLTETQQQTLLNAARATILRALGDDRMAVPDLPDPAFDTPAGCFVTLHSLGSHRLRGCIGMIRTNAPLRDSVLEMAAAVLDDPRFRSEPVTLDEVPQLEIEITVLSPLEVASHPTDFDLLEHGIYLQCEGESGCFLPQVARETGWTREQLLDRLCTEKMGVAPDAWRSPKARLSRFRTLIVGPQPFLV